MKFLKYINNLLTEYSDAARNTDNGVLLLAPVDGRPLLGKHTIFPPMSEKLLQHLCDSYKRQIPPDLLRLYQTANGLNLFMEFVPLAGCDIQIPFHQLCVYGIPITNTRDRLEPYNISIEDLSRPKDTPPNWLKFGSFRNIAKKDGCYKLFVDTDTGAVYLCADSLEMISIKQEWKTIDDCLCQLMEQLSVSDS